MSLRILAPQAGTEVRSQVAETSTLVDSYMERLVKLVPAEAVAAYPLIKPLAVSVGDWAVWFLSWVLLGVVVVLRWQTTSVAGRGPQRTAVVIACVSFVIWVYVLKGDFGLSSAVQTFVPVADTKIADTTEFLSTLALVIWTIVIPVFYRGDTG